MGVALATVHRTNNLKLINFVHKNYVIDDFINENNDILVLVQTLPSHSHNGTATARENFTTTVHLSTF